MHVQSESRHLTIMARRSLDASGSRPLRAAPAGGAMSCLARVLPIASPPRSKIDPMTTSRTRLLLASGLIATAAVAAVRDGGAAAQLTEPFRGVTRAGAVEPGLFAIRSTGVSTAPIRDAAAAFVASLTAEQRQASTFPVDSEEWRDWQNIHRYQRKGINFKSMTDAQRERAFALLAASLSARGLTQTRDIMRLNHTIAEMTGKFDEYGEGLYHLTFMGEPSATAPWGWQLDGHHLVINYFVIGDQVVMTPTFMGSEPTAATDGKYKGTRILGDEQSLGLSLMQRLRPEQRKKAQIETTKSGNNALSQAFRDNIVLDYAGIRGADLDKEQRDVLLRLMSSYVRNMRDEHATVRLQEVVAHLDDTYFAWIGAFHDTSSLAGGTPDPNLGAVFYYRIHSPVILIEFDHQLPVALPGPRVPNRDHVHTVVRTPNGNDYGKDLLRQHYERERRNPAHPHQ
jgi:hypothetical protein